MKVSVVITTFRRPDTLRRAALSVIGQTYGDIELIIVNDNGLESPFNHLTRAVVEALSEKFEEIVYVEHEVNLNGAAARNSGIKVASGELITFLDDDDIFLPQRLERLVRVFEENSNLHCLYSGVGFTQGLAVIGVSKPQLYEDYIYQLLLQNSFIGTGSNFVCRTGLVREISGFDERFSRHQDIEFLIRYLDHFPNISSVQEVLVLKTIDDRVNFPSAASMQKVKTLFFTEFDIQIASYSTAQQAQIFRANLWQQVTVAAMNHEWPSEVFSILGEYYPEDFIRGKIAPRMKWLILQTPGLAQLRKAVTVFSFRLLHRHESKVIERAFLGYDSFLGA